MNVLCYEYSNPKSEDQIKKDITLVMGFIEEYSEVKNIILLGVSIGTYANFQILSENIHNKHIVGIIAISPTWVYNPPFSSQVMDLKKAKKEMTELIDTLRKISIPVFIIHGKKDGHVKYLHSISISKNISNLFEWYPKQGEHLTIQVKYRCKFFSKLKLYLHSAMLKSLFMRDNTDNNNNTFVNNSKNSKLSPSFSLKYEENYIIPNEGSIRITQISLKKSQFEKNDMKNLEKKKDECPFEMIENLKDESQDKATTLSLTQNLNNLQLNIEG